MNTEKWIYVHVDEIKNRKKELERVVFMEIGLICDSIIFKGSRAFVVVKEGDVFKCLVFFYKYDKNKPSFYIKKLNKSQLLINYCSSKKILEKLTIENWMSLEYITWYSESKKLIKKMEESKEVIPGAIVRFDEVLKFSSGISAQTFIYEGKNVFLGLSKSRGRYSINKWRGRSFEIVGYTD